MIRNLNIFRILLIHFIIEFLSRYYGGNEFIDKLELLAQSRSLELYNLDPASWGVNVQPYSGSPVSKIQISGTVQSGSSILGG